GQDLGWRGHPLAPAVQRVPERALGLAVHRRGIEEVDPASQCVGHQLVDMVKVFSAADIKRLPGAHAHRADLEARAAEDAVLHSFSSEYTPSACSGDLLGATKFPLPLGLSCSTFS